MNSAERSQLYELGRKLSHPQVDVRIRAALDLGEHPNGQSQLEALMILLATKEAVALMPEGGAIINIGSNMGEIAPPNGSVYVATKAAVNALTRSLAKELGPRKIRVLAVNPGATDTEGIHTAGLLGGDFEKMMLGMTPLGRIGRVDDIAPVVAFLASDDARWVTGSWLDVAGGMR